MIKKITNRFLSKYEKYQQKSNPQNLTYGHLKFESGLSDKWADFEARITKEANDDPSNFLRQPTISHTLHPNQQFIGNHYFEEVIHSKVFDNEYLNLLSEDNVGNPYNLRIYPRTSPTLTQHIHHLIKIHEVFGHKLTEFPKIVEFGGGYGSLARILARLNYTGLHIICDLQSMTQLQEFYLKCIGKPLHRVEWVNTLHDVNVGTTKGEILIATWSFSETPTSFRETIIDKVMSFDNIFLTFQADFDGFDNLSYFNELTDGHENIEIIESSIYADNYYLIKRSNF